MGLDVTDSGSRVRFGTDHVCSPAAAAADSVPSGGLDASKIPQALKGLGEELRSKIIVIVSGW